VPDNVVIIGIDEDSFPKPDNPWTAEQLARAPDLAYLTPNWPWSRVLWGRMTDRLLQAGARSATFDLAFITPEDGDKECGQVFARQAAHVVIAGLVDEKVAEMGNGGERVVQFNDPVDDLIPDSGPDIVGMANVNKDTDGIERRIQHAYNLDLEKNPEYADDPKFMAQLKADSYSLTWLAAQKALGHDPAFNPWESMHLNYYGPERTLLTISIDDVILNWDTAYWHGDYFKDKYVFIGALAQTRFKDYFDTPFGNMPGVEVQATAFENLINGEWLRPAPGWVAPGLAILFGAFALFVSLRIHSVLGKAGLLLGLGLLFAAVTQWLFTAHLLMVPVAGVALGLVGCGGFGTVYDFMLERYERRRMLGVFESMVSPGVANLVLSNREDFEQRLGGQRKDVVILFCDIRGFTTWSEKVGPDALVTQLNEYFYGMVEVIQQEGGTVQKYIGDALMAAWGDVYERPLKESSISAVRAALRMGDELNKLNANWVGKPKREQLAIGVGINLGDGVVGRIGHPRRQEFTVMGDAVNLAARLESATKQYHQTILIGEKIYELARDQFDFRLADKMQVKGKTFAVPVYVPIGPKAGSPPPGLAEYDAAVAQYYARDFAGADKLFQAANAIMGGDDYLCENFVSRCQFYLAEPPPPDWDGGWVLKDK
jgi:adenylate cyclase